MSAGKGEAAMGRPLAGWVAMFSVAALGLGGCASQPPAETAPQAHATPAARFAPAGDLEALGGIQVTQVGVTAAGGLVDLRFKVLDAAKARKLLGDPANIPVLVAQGGLPLHAPHNALKGAKYGDGLVYFILYPNVRGAVRPGDEVTVAMGETRYGPVTVR